MRRLTPPSFFLHNTTGTSPPNPFLPLFFLCLFIHNTASFLHSSNSSFLSIQFLLLLLLLLCCWSSGTGCFHLSRNSNGDSPYLIPLKTPCSFVVFFMLHVCFIIYIFHSSPGWRERWIGRAFVFTVQQYASHFRSISVVSLKQLRKDQQAC